MFRLENENIISRWDRNAHQAYHTGKKLLLKSIAIGYKYNAIILLKTLARGVFSKDRNQIGRNYFSEISPPHPPIPTPCSCRLQQPQRTQPNRRNLIFLINQSLTSIYY